MSRSSRISGLSARFDIYNIPPQGSRRVSIRTNKVNCIFPGQFGKFKWRRGMQVIITHNFIRKFRLINTEGEQGFITEFTLIEDDITEEGRQWSLPKGCKVVVREDITFSVTRHSDSFEIENLSIQTNEWDLKSMNIAVTVPENLTRAEIIRRNLELLKSDEYNEFALEESQGDNTDIGIIAVNIRATPEGRFVSPCNMPIPGFKRITFLHRFFTAENGEIKQIDNRKIVKIIIPPKDKQALESVVAETAAAFNASLSKRSTRPPTF